MMHKSRYYRFSFDVVKHNMDFFLVMKILLGMFTCYSNIIFI